jgi:benzoate 4-monooxygenase
LRLHSTTAIGLHRSAPPGGLVCCGHFFPEGVRYRPVFYWNRLWLTKHPQTELSVPAWTIGHDAELWGDPEVFRPERWLEGKEKRQYLLAFGKGPRACVRFALHLSRAPDLTSLHSDRSEASLCLSRLSGNTYFQPSLAYMEMITVLATILLRYKVEVRSSELETAEGFMHKPLHCWIKLNFR